MSKDRLDYSSPGEPKYTTELNPHNSLVPLRPGKLWKCTLCGLVDTMGRINKVACTYIYPPCAYCGLSPICAIDCKRIIGLVTSDDVYLAGLTDHEEERYRDGSL